MKVSVKKFADWVGVSVRTLHYYDEIGLLSPDDTDETTGYRYYGENAFSRMQEILFYRELDFSLKEIAEMLASPSYDKQKALRGQRELLLLKKERLSLCTELSVPAAGRNDCIYIIYGKKKAPLRCLISFINPAGETPAPGTHS